MPLSTFTSPVASPALITYAAPACERFRGLASGAVTRMLPPPRSATAVPNFEPVGPVILKPACWSESVDASSCCGGGPVVEYTTDAGVFFGGAVRRAPGPAPLTAPVGGRGT